MSSALYCHQESVLCLSRRSGEIFVPQTLTACSSTSQTQTRLYFHQLGHSGMLEVNRRGVGGLPARAGHLPWPEKVSPMILWAELLVMEYQKPGHLGDTGSYPVWHLSCPTTLSQPNIMPLYGGAATQFPIWIFNHTDNHNQTSHQILKSLLQSFQSNISKYKLQPE